MSGTALSETVLTRMALPAAASSGLHIWESGGWQRYDYPYLLERAERVAAGLESKGVDPGDRVAAVASTSLAFVLSCLGTWRAGAAVVPVQPSVRAGRPPTDAAHAQLRLVRTKALLVGDSDGSGKYSVPVWRVDELERGGQPTANPGSDGVAVVQFTSGSTAEPKAVVLRHAAITAQVDALTIGYGIRPGDRSLSWLPLYHDLGFIRKLLFPMAAGIDSYHYPTPRFLADPLSWLVEVTDQQATTTAGPSSAFAMVTRRLLAAPREIRSRLDLGSLRVTGCGGEPVSPGVVQSFCTSAAEVGFNEASFWPGYGLAEATCVVTLPHGLRVDRVARSGLPKGIADPSTDDGDMAEFVCNGAALSGLQVAIADESGEALPDRRLGEVIVRGPTVMDGYFENEEETTRALRNGWLRTGDLGYMVEQEIYVVGRIKDVVIIGGQNYVAEDLERLAWEVPGVRAGSCVALGVQSPVSEGLVLIAETRLQDADERSQCADGIKRHIWRTTGLRVREVVMVEPGAIPKTSSGKLQRQLARGLYEESAPAPWKAT